MTNSQTKESDAMSNQASEDERNKLKEKLMYADTSEKIRDVISFVHSRTLSIGVYSPGDISVKNMYEEAASDIAGIIRTEKLKLLAEVRERVIGEDVELNSFEIPMFEEEFVITSVTQQNHLRADQRISLAKLEAEL